MYPGASLVELKGKSLVHTPRLQHQQCGMWLHVVCGSIGSRAQHRKRASERATSYHFRPISHKGASLCLALAWLALHWFRV